MSLPASIGALRLALAAAAATGCAPHSASSGAGPGGVPAAAPAAEPGPAPRAQAQGGRSGTVIVLNKGEASAWLIDAGSGQVVARLETGNGPHEVAVSPDGRRAVVGDYGDRGAPGNSLTVIDIPGRRVVGKVSLAPYRRPHGMAWLPDGRRVAVTAEADQMVLVVDVDAGRVEAAIPTGAAGSHMLALSADGRRVYTANIPSGTVTALDVERRAAVGTAPAGRGSEGLALSPDGSQVWVGNREDHTVTVIDTRTMTPIDTLPSGQLPFRVAFTPDGREAIVANAMSGELRIFDVAGRRETAVVRVDFGTPGAQTPDAALTGQGAPLGMAVSPDGRWLYAADGEQPLVTVVDLRERRVVAFFRTGAGPDGIGFSPVEAR